MRGIALALTTDGLCECIYKCERESEREREGERGIMVIETKHILTSLKLQHSTLLL